MTIRWTDGTCRPPDNYEIVGFSEKSRIIGGTDSSLRFPRGRAGCGAAREVGLPTRVSSTLRRISLRLASRLTAGSELRCPYRSIAQA